MLHVFLVMFDAGNNDHGVNSAWPDYESAENEATALRAADAGVAYWVEEVGGDS